jgi:HSP20 family protein
MTTPYIPNVNIYESADSLWLRADMPGVDDQSLEVDLADGVLSLFGRVNVKEYENVQPVYTEYNIGNYARRFTLSKDIDTDRISARMIKGVLELQLPKLSEQSHGISPSRPPKLPRAFPIRRQALGWVRDERRKPANPSPRPVIITVMISPGEPTATGPIRKGTHQELTVAKTQP